MFKFNISLLSNIIGGGMDYNLTGVFFFDYDDLRGDLTYNGDLNISLSVLIGAAT